MKKFEVVFPDKIARMLGSTRQEIEERLFEEAVLSLVADGNIDRFEAAELLSCDPNDLLTPDQEDDLARSFEEIQHGQQTTWQQHKKDLN